MSKASMEKVESLHNLVANYYIEMLEEGEELSSGTLAAINTFLKNNDVKVDILEQSGVQDLSASIKQLITEQGNTIN